MSSLLRNYTSTTAVLTALDSAECAMSDSQVLETSIANVAASQDRGQVTIVIAKDLQDDKEGVSLWNFLALMNYWARNYYLL